MERHLHIQLCAVLLSSEELYVAISTFSSWQFTAKNHKKDTNIDLACIIVFSKEHLAIQYTIYVT